EVKADEAAGERHEKEPARRGIARNAPQPSDRARRARQFFGRRVLYFLERLGAVDEPRERQARIDRDGARRGRLRLVRRRRALDRAAALGGGLGGELLAAQLGEAGAEVGGGH